MNKKKKSLFGFIMGTSAKPYKGIVECHLHPSNDQRMVHNGQDYRMICGKPVCLKTNEPWSGNLDIFSEVFCGGAGGSGTVSGAAYC